MIEIGANCKIIDKYDTFYNNIGKIIGIDMESDVVLIEFVSGKSYWYSTYEIEIC